MTACPLAPSAACARTVQSCALLRGCRYLRSVNWVFLGAVANALLSVFDVNTNFRKSLRRQCCHFLFWRSRFLKLKIATTWILYAFLNLLKYVAIVFSNQGALTALWVFQKIHMRILQAHRHRSSSSFLHLCHTSRASSKRFTLQS